MGYCPKCKSEFQDWVKVCPDCGVELTDEPPTPVLKPDYLPKEKLVTIAAFSHPEEAHVYRAKLESEGIWCVIADEHIVNLDWLYTTAVGGVKLRVMESDVEESMRVLEQIPRKIPETIDNSGERCPNCNSADIHYEMFWFLPVFIIWLISAIVVSEGGFTIPILRRKWKCNNCGNTWKKIRPQENV